ncbi:MAG: PhoH family protein [Lachnospiraceae bacterium]
MSLVEQTLAVPAEHEQNISGQFDMYIKKIERSLRVTILSRDGLMKVVGPEEMVGKAISVLNSLLELSRRGNQITEQNVDYTLALSFEEKQDRVVELDDDVLCRTINGKPVKPKTLGQKAYVDAIQKHMITFGIGPAGTGKTYLAMAMAVKAFKNDEVSRIIMTRPAIEAGEKLGFLPGDLQSKVDPYLRPLYDALYQMMGPEATQANMEKGMIEVAPLAYMRGRTLDNAFIILDEAQNTTSAQMKMFLTRIGFGSKVVVTGDATQRDLDINITSGLETAQKVLRKVEGIAFANLDSRDIVRHPLVQQIVEAYEAYEEQENKKQKNEKRFSKEKNAVKRSESGRTGK